MQTDHKHLRKNKNTQLYVNNIFNLFQKAQNIVVYTDRKEYRNFDKSVRVQKIRERFFL